MLEYDEKRDFPRIPVDCPAQLQFEGKIFTATVKNLSGGGTLLWLDDQIPDGASILMTVTPENTVTPPLLAEISVIRCIPVEGETYFEAACSISKIVD